MTDNQNVLNNSNQQNSQASYGQAPATPVHKNETPPPSYFHRHTFNPQTSNSYYSPNYPYSPPPPPVNNRTAMPSTNPFTKDIRPSLPATLPDNVQVVEQSHKPYWESGENSFDNWSRQTSQDQAGAQHEPQSPDSAQDAEYYYYEEDKKKKGLSKKIDRLVKRIPALGLFYKQSSVEQQLSEGQPGSDQLPPDPQMMMSVAVARPLTATEIGLHARYTDPSKIRIIKLQAKEETQPVDIRIRKDNNLIYLCDVGRSLIEIFDFQGALQHVIDTPAMLKFQPTALIVAFDGTIITASYFNHCLCMYSPVVNVNDANENPTELIFRYKAYQLGEAGSQIHQFSHPAGMTIDPTDGCVYICDRANSRIKALTPEGVCIRVMQLAFRAPNKKKFYLEAIRIAYQPIYDRLVCIIDGTGAICFLPKASQGKTYVEPLVVSDENGLGLEDPSGIAIDGQDRIFIADTGHHRIVVCTAEGGYITSFGNCGTGIGQLTRPCGLDITSDGTVAVTDAGNRRIQMFGANPDLISVDPPAPASTENPPPANGAALDLSALL